MQKILFVLLAAIYSGSASGDHLSYRLELAPHTGGGSMTSSKSVRHASGYGVQLYRPAWHSRSATVGPWVQLGNQFLSATESTDTYKDDITYDHRIISAGIKYERDISGATLENRRSLYIATSLGKAYSKAELNRSSANTYRQSNINGIQGTVYTGEIGAYTALKKSLGVSIGVIGQNFRLKQNEIAGTFQQESVVDGQLQLTEGSLQDSSAVVSDLVVIKTFGVKLGLALDF